MIAAAALVAGVAVGLVADRQASSHLRDALQGKLAALLETRRASLDSVREAWGRDLRFLAGDPQLVRAMSAFVAGWSDLGPNAASELRRLYIDENPYPLEGRGRLEQASDPSVYSIAHSRYHRWFDERVRTYSYVDLVLIVPDGRVIYSVAKGDYFAADLRSDADRDGALGTVFNALTAEGVLTAEGDDKVGIAFADFHRSDALGGAIVGVMGAPIRRPDGGLTGIVALVVPVAPVEAVMTAGSGLGKTGQTYLVGGDHLLRSTARLAERPTILSASVKTPAVDGALAGASGVRELAVPPAGTLEAQPLTAAFAPYDFFGVRYALIAEAGLAEVLAPVADMRRGALAGGVLVMVLVALGGMGLARGLVRPLTALTGAMLRLADGELAVPVPNRERRDEIGAVAGAVQVFKDNLIEVQRLQEERERHMARLAEANRLITTSIQCARRIQRSLLKTEEQIARVIPDHLLIWQPRDIVGGDFYWLHVTERGYVVAVVDCTGHGVPGALMTMIAAAAFDRVLAEGDATDPAGTLAAWNRLIKSTLGQGRDNDPRYDDGVEAGICYVDLQARRLHYAGARFSLWTVSDEGPVSETKGDRCGIGSRRVPMEATFAKYALDMASGTAFFLASDGVTDQIGGQGRVAFGKKRFAALLGRHARLPLADQKPLIMAELDAYRGGEVRRDDVTVFGFRPLA